MSRKREPPLFSAAGLADLDKRLEARVKPRPKRRTKPVLRFKWTQLYKQTMRYLHEGAE